MSKHNRIHTLALALGLALGATGANAALLGNLTQSLGGILKTPAALAGGSQAATQNGVARDAAILSAAQTLADTIQRNFPTLEEQAAASPDGIYQLYHASLHSPLQILAPLRQPATQSSAQSFLNAFPSPQGFSDWLVLLESDPAAAARQYAASPGANAATLTNMNNVTRMLADRLPTNLANNLPVVGQMLAGLLGGGKNGGGPFATHAQGGGISHTAIGQNGVEQMWCDVTGQDSLLGRILRGALGAPAVPSPGGKGYGPSLLPHLGLGSSPTGSGFSQSLDYVPLLNSNQLTGPLREILTPNLPVLQPILPNSILGLVTFRTYHVTDRTGAGADQHEVPVNDPLWTAAAIDLGVPGLRIFTVEFICPGLNRHRTAPPQPVEGTNLPSAAAFPSLVTNPNFDPAAERNYTGWTNLDLKNRKLTLSWGFGDGLVDDVWVYGHYVPFTLFGAGDTGPGLHHPAEHQPGNQSADSHPAH
jgi:hypothetical protein